ncbi:hypothetical protein ACFO26_01550 [Lactococcus nasutitermitis]|uniref:Uncharacterized protein n=1 Tax=Lactococcus nasutitermitis TaxID=1652957 RepID=A0ABV9JBY8_9LACT|nr:hypothetical protein [Lactococcus nasutitermitis]
MTITKDRYLYESKKSPDKKINLVCIFTDETIQLKGYNNKRTSPPYKRMQSLTEKAGHIKALNGLPFLGELEKQKNLTLYFFTYNEALQRLGPLLNGEYFPDFVQREYPKVEENKKKVKVQRLKQQKTKEPQDKHEKYIFE